ncbi:MAG: TIGR01212 family radical SAM protein [Lachnospiraceae bacterium]|nr:TIGR01212 family radical SAM protein [Lachnospiraceae bacterium]
MDEKKPYNSLSAYLKREYGEKVFKIALDGGFTCPNRDGTKGDRGCIFCSAGGSGEFATSVTPDSIPEQIEKALGLFGSKNVGRKYIAYFQAYTGTYGDPSRLYSLYRAALSHPLICGISIATRPDCLGPEVLDVLSRCKQEFPDKFLWVELGLQTIHARTAAYIRRGYPLSCFEEAMANLHGLDVPVIVHVILGLPGETDEDMLATIDYLNGCHIFGIKLQLLHVLRDTDLATDYANGLFTCLTKEHYLALLIRCIDRLDPEIVLHRVTGDGPADLLIAPEWSLYKWDTLNSLHRLMKEGGHYQGKDFPRNRS